MRKDKKQVIGDEIADESIKLFLQPEPADDTPPSLHKLIKAYRGLRIDDFERFVRFSGQADPPKARFGNFIERAGQINHPHPWHDFERARGRFGHDAGFARRVSGRGDHRIGADHDARLDEDAGAKAHAIADLHAARRDDGWAKAAVAAQHRVVFDAAVGAEEIVVAHRGAGPEMAEGHDDVARPHRDIHPNDCAGMEHIGKGDVLCLPAVEEALAHGNAGAD